MEALNQDLQLITEHFPEIQNSRVEAFSRLARKGDYSMKKEFLYPILANLGLETWLYAFATRMNRRLERHCSLMLDHSAYSVNAYSSNWRNLNPFLHPPMPQIPRTLVKVQKDKAEAVIIIPDWKGQIWDQLLKEMTVKEVVQGWAEEVLEKGKTMVDLNLHLLP
ncbi:MAG: hypothetical protein EZS28_053754, partial [Streblomastix strix]